jgi:hypothetical protein
MRRFLKYSLAAIGLLAFFVVLVLIVSRTSFFRNWLRDRIVAAVPVPGGDFAIGGIDGNLVTGFELRDVRLDRNGETLVRIHRIAASYTLSGLTHREIHVRFLEIDSLSMVLRQELDSTWNVEDVFRGEPAHAETVSAPAPDWTISVDRLSLNHWNAEVVPLDTAGSMPRRLVDFTARMRGSYTPERQILEVEDLSLQTGSPEVIIAHLGVQLERTAGRIHATGLDLRTNHNRIRGEATLVTGPALLKADLVTDPLDFAEFAFLLGGFTVQDKPELTIHAEYDGNALHAAVVSVRRDERIEVTGQLAQQPDGDNFSADVRLFNADLAPWIGKPALETKLRGRVRGSGRLFHGGGVQVQVSAALHDSRAAGRSLDSMDVTAHYDRGDVSGTFDASGGFGNLRGQADITGLLTPRPSFALLLSTREFNLAPVLEDPHVQSSLRLHLEASGQGLTFSTLTGRAVLSATRSSVMGYGIDTFYTDLSGEHRRITVDTLYGRTPAVQLSASGIVDPAADSRIDFRGRVLNAMSLSRVLGVDTLLASGEYRGSVRGTLDTLTGVSDIALEDIHLYGVSAGRGMVSVKLDRRSPGLSMSASAAFDSVRYGEYVLDSLRVDGAYVPGQVSATVAAFSGDSLEVRSRAKIGLDSVVTVALEDLLVRFRELSWRTPNDSARASVSREGIEIRNFALTSGDQSIRADGMLTSVPGESLRVDVRQFRLQTLRQVLPSLPSIGGSLNLDFTMHGPTAAPQFLSAFRLSDLRYDTVSLGIISGTAAYRDSTATWAIQALLPRGNSFLVNGSLPLSVSPDDGTTRISRSRPLQIRVKTDSLDLSRLRVLSGKLWDVRGKLIADLRMSRTGGRATVSGVLSVRDAGVRSPRLGIDYPSITATVRSEGDLILLEELAIRKGEGTFIARGTVGSADALLQGFLEPLDLQLTVQKFEALKSRYFQLEMNGNAGVKATQAQISLAGDLLVNRALLNLSALRQTPADEEAGGQRPLLVDATRKDTVRVGVADTTRQPIARFDRPVNGKVHFTIPRNTWVESPNLQMELAGDVDLVFTDSRLELFGYVDVLRGFYAMYGVNLQFKGGRVRFTGGEEFNPNLDLTLAHEFRTGSGPKSTVEVKVSGTAKDPIRQYTLDGQPITEDQAFSYILFGSAGGSLSAGQQSQASGTGNQFMENLTSSMVSQQLSATVGKSLGLDVVQVKGEDNWSKTSFTAGKYVTNSLFVSYEKGFGSYDANEVAPEIFTLEYQILRFLYLQMVGGNDPHRSGTDVIVKIE